MNFIQGEVLLIDKPYGWTSFQVVNKIRWLICRKLNIKKIKVGHAGTLDPLATGLMIVCTGLATKKIDELTGFDKEYIAEVKLGETTPSFDKETAIDFTFPVNHITKELIDTILHKFKGEIDQVPPVFSAKYIDGKRAYSFARKGIDVEMKPHKIYIESIDLLKYENTEITLRINCSKGTYIRALARDIGNELNSGAYLAGLQRTRIGNFHLTDAVSIESFEKKLVSL